MQKQVIVPQAMVSQYQCGVATLTDIARFLGCSGRTVSNALRRQGIPPAFGNGAKTFRNNQVVEAFKRGDSVEDIARTHGITTTRVGQIAHFYGCAKRRKNKSLTHYWVGKLGTMTDTAIGKLVGMDQTTVSEKRRKLGIKAFKKLIGT